MKKRILCYGDSNTWGYDAETNGQFDDAVRWTGVLSAELGDGYRVITEGLCGRTSVYEDPLNEGLNGLTYLYPCLMSHSFIDYLIIMLGTNDVKERFSATPKNIAGGMKRLAVKASQAPVWKEGPKILLVAPGPIEKACESSPVAGEMGVCSEKSEKLAVEYRLVAEELGLHFYDAGEITKMNRIDYMHLDAPSHERLGRNLKEIIIHW